MTARSVILILNHFNDRQLREQHADIAAACGDECDVVLLSDRTRPSRSFARSDPEAKEFSFTVKDLIALRYPGKQELTVAGQGPRRLNFGNAELPLLLFFAAHRHYAHYWLVEYDVQFSGSWRDFFGWFDNSNADLLGTSLIRQTEYPEWNRWQSLVVPSRLANDGDQLRGFFPIYRVSNDALRCLDDCYRQHCQGHMETLVPTVLHRSGLRLEDIGGDGEFVNPANINRFYTNHRLTDSLSPGTFVYRPVRHTIGAEPNKLWHPVKARPHIVARLLNRFL